MAGELKGKFVYSKTANGNFNFRLKASNNETIAVSDGVYPALKNCKLGIDSVRKFSVIDKVEDQTVKDYEVLTNPKFELYKPLGYSMFAVFLLVTIFGMLYVNKSKKMKIACEREREL